MSGERIKVETETQRQGQRETYRDRLRGIRDSKRQRHRQREGDSGRRRKTRAETQRPLRHASGREELTLRQAQLLRGGGGGGKGVPGSRRQPQGNDRDGWMEVRQKEISPRQEAIQRHNKGRED